MYGPSFATVGENNTAKLKDVVYNATETGDLLLLIDPATAAYDELIFINQADAIDLVGEDAVAGWYKDLGDDVFEYKGNIDITLGCAFWICPYSGAVDMTNAGEVKMTFTRTLPNYTYSAVANPFPTKVPLSTFNYAATETGDLMLLIDKETAAYTELIFINQADAIDLVGQDAVAGWYFDEGDDVFTYQGGVMLEPGQGSWYCPYSGDVVITATLDAK